MLALSFPEYYITSYKRLYAVDHILPVWKSKGRIEFFQLDNMQLLDVACHAAKTKQDMKDRRWQKAIIDQSPELADSIRHIKPTFNPHKLHD